MSTAAPWWLEQQLDGRYVILSAEDAEGVPVAKTVRQPEERKNADLLCAGPKLHADNERLRALLREARRLLPTGGCAKNGTTWVPYGNATFAESRETVKCIDAALSETPEGEG